MRLFFLILFCTIHLLGTAQNDPTQVEIPMRDGKVLAGDLYLPNDTDTFPTILIMTPYGKFFYALNGLPLGVQDDIASSQYAFLIVDWRCRFASLSACAIGSDNGEDGYDVVQWAAEQSWSNGKIGMWGPSALGNIQFQTAREQPPALTCIVPEVTAPYEYYAKYYPGGALLTARMETFNFLFPSSTNLVLANPHDNLIWTIAQNNTMYPDRIEVPTLLVGGWYDINLHETILLSDTLQGAPAADQVKTLIGPWVHGGNGQAVVGSANQGELLYPEAEDFNYLFANLFFGHYLLNEDNGWDDTPRFTFFQMGKNDWFTSENWPPDNTATSFFLSENGSLTTALFSGSESVSYIYDPNDPSPTIGGKTLNFDLDQGPFDQREEVESRSDHAIFTSEELAEDLHIQGKPSIRLFVSSDRLDTDFAIRLTDVYPDGRSMLLSEYIQRMRFRNGYRVQDTMMMTPGEVYEIEIPLGDLAHTFLEGHQIRVIITSSNYPKYNRNMNTGAEMYPDNNIDSLVNPLIAQNNIHFGQEHMSQLIMPVVPNTSVGISKPEVDMNISIFPNPTKGMIHFKSESSMEKIKIYDFNGKVIFYTQYSGHHLTANLEGNPSGIYLLKIETNGKTITRKITLI